MRSRVPAVLLLLLCVLTGAGRHADEAARAVAAAQPPSGQHDPALGQPPFDATLPTLLAAPGGPKAGGSAALLPAGAWPARPGAGEPAEADEPVAAAAAGHSISPARAPPGSSTR